MINAAVSVFLALRWLGFVLGIPAGVILLFLAAIVFLCFVPMLHGLRRVTSELRRLPLQIHNFEVRQAECFCCANQHVHPQTSTVLPCDRSLVYSTLQTWFPQRHSGPASHDSFLDTFDEHVRTLFASAVLAEVGGSSGSRVTYKTALVAGYPILWSAFDLFVMAANIDLESLMRVVAEIIVCVLQQCQFVYDLHSNFSFLWRKQLGYCPIPLWMFL